MNVNTPAIVSTNTITIFFVSYNMFYSFFNIGNGKIARKIYI